MKSSDVKALAANLLPHLGDLIKAEVAKHVSGTAAITAGSVIDTAEALAETAFIGNNPGIGGAPPAVAEDATVESRLTALEHKLDALVQATGHGNSYAMGAHL
jgi:hypothetical protein